MTLPPRCFPASLSASQISPTHSAPAPLPSLLSPPVTPSTTPREVRWATSQYSGEAPSPSSSLRMLRCTPSFASFGLVAQMTFLEILCVTQRHPSCDSIGDAGAFATSPTSVFPPSATFPSPASQNAFPHEQTSNQEANGTKHLSNSLFIFHCISLAIHTNCVPQAISYNTRVTNATT